MRVLAVVAGTTALMTVSAPSARAAENIVLLAGDLYGFASSEHADSRSSTPPPLPIGRRLERFSDFRNNDWAYIFQRRWSDQTWSALDYVGQPWADGSGVYEITTRHGPGFRMVQNEAVPRGSGALVGMADVDHFVDRQAFLGTVTDFSGKVMFPRSGNPNGFPRYRDWNVLWEFTQDVAVHNLFGVDALARGGPTIYVRTFDSANPDNQNGRKARGRSPIQYDRWYDWRWQIKWSEGSDGFVNFWFGGRRVAAWTGPSLSAANGGPYLEWGWYGGHNPGRNEVRYSQLRKR